MRTITLTIFISIFGLFSCDVSIYGQEVDNLKPMYGEVEKTEYYKKLDADFIKTCLDQFGTIDSSVAVYIKHAWRYYYNNDLKTSMKRFNQVWLLNPDYADSYFGFAALLETQKNDKEAERFYKMAIVKDKSGERAKKCYQRIADCKEKLEDYIGTIKAYVNLTEIDPTNSFPYKKLGYFYMQSENVDNALKAYSKAIELDPNDANTYNNLGYLFQQTKDYSKAIIEYTKAINIEPKYIGAIVNRGISKMETGDFEGARNDFDVCVQLDEKSGELRQYLGHAKLKLKDTKGACIEFTKAKKLGSTQVDDLIKENCK